MAFLKLKVVALPKKFVLSEHLRAARIRRGLSVAEVADACGVSAGAVYMWETGRASPRSENLTAICRALKLPIRATRELAAA